MAIVANTTLMTDCLSTVQEIRPLSPVSEGHEIDQTVFG